MGRNRCYGFVKLTRKDAARKQSTLFEERGEARKRTCRPLKPSSPLPWALIHGAPFQDTQISSNDATIEIRLLTHFHFYTTIDLNLFKSGGGSVSSLAIKEESE